jgi:RNA polymerase sigma-70 factor (ECF subfamily)
MPIMDHPDAALMRRTYDEHAAALFRYALRLTRDHARAEDVVQETLLKVWRHPEVMKDPERSPRAWLFTVARNMIIDEQRSARFRSESAVPDPEAAHDGAGADEADSTVDRLLLSSALARISDAHRAVILRSYYRGWTTAQIAADLHIAEGTVRSRLHYAMRALRLALEEMGYSDARGATAPREPSAPAARGPVPRLPYTCPAQSAEVVMRSRTRCAAILSECRTA